MNRHPIQTVGSLCRVACLWATLLAMHAVFAADPAGSEGPDLYLESCALKPREDIDSDEAAVRDEPAGMVLSRYPVFCAGIPREPAFDLRIPDKPPAGKRTLIPVNERQGSAVLYEGILNGPAGRDAGIVISLSGQRVYLLLGGEIAIDSPIASGRREGWTPKGAFRILEKDPDHRSNRYGDLLDGNGRVVRRNVTCGASGGTFRGATMKWFLRLTWEGVGMHAGILPGYPASHGCIRLPREVAERLYRIVPTGTPVLVTD